MNMSAGAPLSICLANVELAAYEILQWAPPCPSNSLAASSSALVRLAAANTTTSCACAARPVPNAISAVTSAATSLVETRIWFSQSRLLRQPFELLVVEFGPVEPAVKILGFRPQILRVDRRRKRMIRRQQSKQQI